MNEKQKSFTKTLGEVGEKYREKENTIVLNYSGTELVDELEKLHNERWVSVNSLVAELRRHRDTSSNNLVAISNWIADNMNEVPEKEIWEHKIQRAADFAEIEVLDKFLAKLGVKENRKE